MNEHRPSKEKLPDWLRRWYALKGELRFREAADEIERLQRQVDALRRERDMSASVAGRALTELHEKVTSHEPPELRAIAERIRDHACAYGAPADSLLVKRELIGQLAQILRGSISEPPPAARKPDKFDLAFEIMRQLEDEDMETMQSCQFGYVMRVTREGHSCGHVEFRPIATAPKDGSTILLRCPKGIVEGCWEQVDGGGHPENGPPVYWWTSPFTEFIDGPYDAPTHWALIPRDAPTKPACNCEGPQKIGPGYHAPYCATMAGTEFAKQYASEEISNAPSYCNCTFTNPDGTVVPGEPCPIHTEK